jgi:hypothetical protein
MARQNIEATESLRDVSRAKINANFTELYAAGGVSADRGDASVTLTMAGTN